MIPKGKQFASMGELAVYLSSNGFGIIPLPSPKWVGYNPRKPLTKWVQYQDKNPTPEEVVQWWLEWPDANIAIITGRGLVVIDIDSEKAVEWAKKNLPYTGWNVKTKRGFHCYYSCAFEVRGGVNKVLDIDVRGDGNYITGPWSLHKSGCYYEPMFEDDQPGVITAEHIEKCRKREVIPISIVDANGNLSIDLSQIRPLNTMDFAESTAEQGERNHTLTSLVGQLIRRGHTETDIKKMAHDTNSTWQNPLPVQEVTETIESVIRTHTRKNPGQPVIYAPPKVQKDVNKQQFDFREFDNSLVPGGLIGALTIWIDGRSHRSCPMFSMGAAISLLGLLMSRKYKDSGRAKPNLFMIMVGPSGCGKDSGMKSIEAIIKKCGVVDRISQGIGSDAALSHEMTQSPAKLFLIDELGKIFSSNMRTNVASHKAQIISKLLKLYSASSGLYKEDDLVGRQAAMVQDPHLNIYGATTPEEFYPSFDKNSFTNGMMGRFLIMETRKSNQIKRDCEISDKNIDGSILMDLSRVRRIAQSDTAIDACINPIAEPNYINIRLTPGADSLAYELAKDFDKKITTSDGETDKIFWAIRSRAMEIVRKLALIHAVSDDPDGVIEERHLLWAKSIVDWSVHNIMSCVETWHHKSFKDMHSKRVIDSITRSREGLLFSQLSDLFLYLPANQRTEIINDLIAGGKIMISGDRYILTGDLI